MTLARLTPARLILAAAFLLAGSMSLAEPALPDDDAREPAPRTKVERAYILGQMRLLVESIQVISDGLATNNMEEVAEAAAARGMRRNANDPAYPASMKTKETPMWKQMGGGIRRGFDEISDAAKTGAPKEKILAILSDTTKNCVACHQTYRLTAAPEQ